MPEESSTGRPVVALLARYLGPTLLCVVAACQIELAAHQQLLTPARGGGFGLFSTVDKLGDRQVRMFRTGPSGSARLGMPAHPGIVKWMKSVAALPSEANLRALADLTESTGRVIEGDGEPPFPTLRVEVWRRAFDHETLEASRVKVAELTVERSR